MTPAERADRASELLASEAFKAVIADTRAGIVTRLESVGMIDHEGQHEAVLLLQLLKQFEATLQRYVDDGAVSRDRKAQDDWREKAKVAASNASRRIFRY